MEQLIEHDTTKELSEERISETPLYKDIAALLEQLREISPHNKPTGRIFASTSSLMVDHIQPAAVRAGVDKRVSWKMLGHANSQITTDVFAQPVPSEVRSAHDKLVDMVILQNTSKERFCSYSPQMAQDS